MKKRTLSSIGTLGCKGLPVLVAIMFPFIVMDLFFGDRSDSGSASGLTSVIVIWIIAIINSVNLRGVKKVSADGSAIYVSNYIREIRIPLDQISDVSGNNYVTISFRQPTCFGNSILFIAPARLFSSTPHPVVAELRELCGLNPSSPLSSQATDADTSSSNGKPGEPASQTLPPGTDSGNVSTRMAVFIIAIAIIWVVVKVYMDSKP